MRTGKTTTTTGAAGARTQTTATTTNDVVLIWGGTDFHACAATLSPDAVCLYIINVILRRHFDLGGYEANRSICGQINSAGCMVLDDGKCGHYDYRLHVTGYEEIRDDFLSSIEEMEQIHDCSWCVSAGCTTATTTTQ